jgi:hypothetical protein
MNHLSHSTHGQEDSVGIFSWYYLKIRIRIEAEEIHAITGELQLIYRWTDVISGWMHKGRSTIKLSKKRLQCGSNNINRTREILVCNFFVAYLLANHPPPQKI